MKKRALFAGIATSVLTAFTAAMQVQNNSEQKQEAARVESTAAKWRDINALPYAVRIDRLTKETGALAVFYDVGNVLRTQLETLQKSIDTNSAQGTVSARALSDGLSRVYTHYGIVSRFYKPEQDEAMRALLQSAHDLTVDVVYKTAADDPALAHALRQIEECRISPEKHGPKDGLTMAPHSP